MKRAGYLILMFFLLSLYVCCGTEENNSKENKIGISKNNSNLLEDTGDINRSDTVESFMELLKKQCATNISAGSKFYDITTDYVYERIGCQVFKDADTCSSYLLYHNRVYPISNGFGGYGIVGIQVCDFNGDGQYDLLYTSSWGSGIHRWEIGLFDFSKMKDSVVYNSYGNTDQYSNDVVLEPTADNSFDIYTVRIELKSDNLADLHYLKDRLIGQVIKENNSPKIILFNKPTIKNGNYIYGNDPEGIKNAAISISDNKFTFVFDLLSSYLSFGTYTIKDDLLTMVTDDGLYHYVFQISGDTLIFKKNKSSSVKLIDSRLGVQVEDNSVFTLERLSLSKP